MVNRLVPVEMEVEPGLIVLGMVLGTLSGRSPLYHLEASFEPCDRELLFGRAHQADAEAACAERMAQSTAYHQLKVSVQERRRYGRARPKQEAPRTPMAMAYALKAEVVEKTEVLAKRQQQAGCFVLLREEVVPPHLVGITRPDRLPCGLVLLPQPPIYLGDMPDALPQVLLELAQEAP